MRKIFLPSLFYLLPILLSANTFYLDPVNGNLNGDGSKINPWSSLKEVIEANLIQTTSYQPLPYEAGVSTLVDKNIGAPIQPGDTLMLMNGMHGAVEIDRHYNKETITIINAPNHIPILAELHFRSCSNWNIEGLTISSEPYGYYTDSHLLYVESHGFRGPSHNFKISNCNLYAGTDSWNWTKEEWIERTTNGIYIRGDSTIVAHNKITNINHGIHLVGRNLVARGNDIVNFSGDGLRPLGGNIIVEKNLIKNCFDINENHDDGIQSFNLNNEDFSNVIIRNNMILNYDDPNQPLLGSLQGIGLFDGPFTNWVVENNVISVDHWHGITFLGAFDCIIRHNTVIDPTPDLTPGPSWIRIDDNKDGTPSEGCIVANNLTNDIVADAQLAGNQIVSDYTAYNDAFIDYITFNFHLNPGYNAINAADHNFKVDIDYEGTPRPQGNGYDIGAYEFIGPSKITKIDNNSIHIFPNPFDTKIHIKYRGGSDINTGIIKVYRYDGRLMKPLVINVSKNKYEIDTSALPFGLYIIKIGAYNYKLVKT